MVSLNAATLLQMWESGLSQSPIKRALTLLALAFPDIPYDRLARLSIIQRDTLLFELYEQLFGTHIDGFGMCPTCHEEVEYHLHLADFRRAPSGLSAGEILEIQTGSYVLTYRLPNSQDMELIAALQDPEIARQNLLRCCIVRAREGDTEVSMDSLPAAALSMLATQLGDQVAQFEIELDLACPACGRLWQVVFDILAFLWAEICVLARKLLYEVSRLARVYGWREADILALSPLRRNEYLQLADT